MRLYQASSSYYSMIARLALVEQKIPFERVVVDIHRRRAHIKPGYVRLNPHMTVPTLVGERVLADSQDIVLFAFGKTRETLDAETARWIGAHYGFPIEELTFGWLLGWNALARRAVPRVLASTEAELRRLAQQHPDLADAYRRRAEVFAARQRTFDAKAIAGLFDERRKEAIALLDSLDAALADGRETLVGGAYGPADVVWTVFLARLNWVKLAPEIARRAALARYTAAMFARPSFEAADVWKRIKIVPMLRQIFQRDLVGGM